VTRWDAFADVCGYLRAGLLGGEPPRRRRNREWKLLVELSSFHFVTPSLAGCLHDEPGVPREIHEYLDAVLALNGQRNALLLDALSRIVATFNAINIEPVLMKGCARLVEGDYPQSNMRILGDLDVLVPMNRATDAYAALMANGFGEIEDDWAPDHHHLPMLRDHKTGAGVEIHRQVSPPRLSPPPLSTPWFCEGTRPFCLQDDLHARLPDPTRSAGLNIVHHQLHNLGYWKNTLELRQLLDLALIRERHETAIDWAELDHHFCRIDMGEALATYLQFCEELLGQKAPPLRCRPRVGAIDGFRRIVDPPKSPKPPKPPRLAPIVTAFAAIVNDYAAARRRDPLGLLKLFSPMKWPPRFKLLKDVFKPPRR
jgi:Uncharacterised nucleotidyltransferase